MEFEIEDQDQDLLFDDDTDPGLRQERHQRRPFSSPNRLADPDEKRGLQRAELIPEEEQQLA